MSDIAVEDRPVDPRRYFESVARERGEVAQRDPVCLYLETTNRCNLPCTTCPRTFEELEPAANMSWDLFRSIVDQYPAIARVVLHGVGEPLMVPNLPRMIRYLKERGTYVLFNTNGTLLNERRGRDLIASGLDELRVSLDAAEPVAFKAVRGKDAFDRIVKNVREFRALQKSLGAAAPRVSLWLTGLKETIGQLPAFVDLAASLDVPEVHLQRMVFFADGQGLSRADQSLFERVDADEERFIREAEARAKHHGILFDASGATEPGTSLKRADDKRPWSLCTRPWTLMYFTAHGRALPCCIAPFSMRGYDAFTLGNATQEGLREIWNGEKYRAFRAGLLSDQPPPACANCGLRWSL
ncbi:MAG TPA: radical SAM protein [Xanthobacteraceae bacterium]|jgi:MoaA/NifB/PqqE/SkfB family radical SAM enzyme|nr:radical SAM protein [Xanthobacteraceae bacterium]